MVYRVVALLARTHGLNGLQALLNSTKYQVVAIATHRLLPKSESEERAERSDFAHYQTLATQHDIPLYTVDSKAEQQKLEETLLNMDYDFLASISWRRLIPLSLINHARFGGVNLHRGRLPDYPGAEPIKQALSKGDKTVVITAHILDEQIDHGRTLCVYEHPVTHQDIERIKDELTSHFGPLLLQALDGRRDLRDFMDKKTERT
ncbi:MAG: formyltransferase family protein [Chlamydiales bacterium]|nr:formyltransferase family protein [Chlamydiales bacterium]